MKKTIIISLTTIILILSIAFFLIKPQITGYSIRPPEYSYTRAMCDESNYCQDYEINCYNGRLVRLKLITGASVQHPSDWKDPREKIDIEDLCKTRPPIL
ncbi:hypothetical protein KAJ38_00840 [Candidatus Pacearchaeota archaeon]|nr:hypothetical protein [Candidatus Pacearchaeota archaeon]